MSAPAACQISDNSVAQAIVHSHPRQGWWLALGILAATGWSLCTSDYRFAQGDDGWQAPMVLHYFDTDLLKGDPLITEIAPLYKSLLFPLMAFTMHGTGSIASAYALVFILNRLLSIAAFAYLTYQVAGKARAGVVAAFLLTGFGFYGFGIYLGRTPLLEEKLVPRAFAVPFACMALAAMIRSRHGLSCAWLIATFLIHPTTGLNLIGVYIIFTLLAYRSVRWTTFGLSALALTLVVGIFVYSARTATGPLLLDDHWRNIIDLTVGPWVFLLKDTAWAPGEFPMALCIGLASAWAMGAGPWRDAYFRIVAAGLLAVLIHLVAVDWLGIHPALEACPERATLVVVVMGGVGLSLLVVRVLEMPGAWSKTVATGLCLAIVLRMDYRIIALLFMMAALMTAPREWRIAGSCMAMVALALLVIVAWMEGEPESASMSQGWFRGISQLKALGVTDQNQLAVEEWIRDHSDKDSIIFPPLRNSRGWEVFSQRSCAFNSSFHTYTHISRPLALDYERLLTNLQAIRNWHDLEQYARTVGSKWIITDQREPRAYPGAPAPKFQSGPYRVLEVQSK
jgi:hypothetical protein